MYICVLALSLSRFGLQDSLAYPLRQFLALAINKSVNLLGSDCGSNYDCGAARKGWIVGQGSAPEREESELSLVSHLKDYRQLRTQVSQTKVSSNDEAANHERVKEVVLEPGMEVPCIVPGQGIDE